MLQIQGGLDLEEFGGSVQVVKISALRGTNFNDLIESILTQAEILDLRADPNPPAEGVIIESKVDNQKGWVVIIIIVENIIYLLQNKSLKVLFKMDLYTSFDEHKYCCLETKNDFILICKWWLVMVHVTFNRYNKYKL